MSQFAYYYTCERNMCEKQSLIKQKMKPFWFKNKARNEKIKIIYEVKRLLNL